MPRRNHDVVLDDLTIEFDADTATPASDERRRPGWIGLLASVAAIALLAGVVWRVADTGGRAEPLAVTTDRLAGRADALWTRSLRGGTMSLDALALPSGAIAISSRGESTAMVSTLDLTDGSTLWEQLFAADVDSSELIAATERSVVVQVNRARGRSLMAFGVDDGSLRWSSPVERDVAFGSLPGAFAIAEYSFDPEPPFTERLSFLDPDTGDLLGEVDGTIASTDWNGTWYVRAGTELLAYDLTDDRSEAAVAPTIEPVRVATSVPRAVTALVVANGSVIGIDGRGRLVDAASNEEIDVPRSWRGEVQSIEFVGGDQGDRIVISNDSRVAGLTVSRDGRGVSVDWEASLNLRQVLVTAKGALVVGSASDRSVSILDAITGAQVVDPADGLEFRPLGPIALRDGFLLPTAGGLRGYRLDGELRWTAPVRHYFAVTDRAVVDFPVDRTGPKVRATGDPCVPDC